MIRSSSISDSPPQYPPHHLIPLGRCVPCHPGASGDGPEAGHVGWTFMYVQIFFCGFGEFIRRSDARALSRRACRSVFICWISTFSFASHSSRVWA